MAGHEQIVSLLPAQNDGPGVGQVTDDPFPRHLAERHQPLFAALAHNAQHAFVQADMKGFQPDQFADAQAAGIHQLEHGAVAQP